MNKKVAKTEKPTMAAVKTTPTKRRNATIRPLKTAEEAPQPPEVAPPPKTGPENSLVSCDAVIIYNGDGSARIYHSTRNVVDQGIRKKTWAAQIAKFPCTDVVSIGVANTWADYQEDGTVGLIIAAGNCSYVVLPRGYFKG